MNANWNKNKKIINTIESLKAYRPEKIYLFGSWARGEGDSLSDIDLVVIKRTKASFFNRLKSVRKYLPDHIGAIDVLIYTPSEFELMRRDENAFAQMIVEEGKLVYERG